MTVRGGRARATTTLLPVLFRTQRILEAVEETALGFGGAGSRGTVCVFALGVDWAGHGFSARVDGCPVVAGAGARGGVLLLALGRQGLRLGRVRLGFPEHRVLLQALEFRRRVLLGEQVLVSHRVRQDCNTHADSYRECMLTVQSIREERERLGEAGIEAEGE